MAQVVAEVIAAMPLLAYQACQGVACKDGPSTLGKRYDLQKGTRLPILGAISFLRQFPHLALLLMRDKEQRQVREITVGWEARGV